MTEGAFWESVNKTKILGNKLKIIKNIQAKKGKYSSAFFDKMHSNDYRIIYDVCIENEDWEIMLIDESIFQFTFRNSEYSMSFYPRPTKFVTYDEWLNWFLFEEMQIKPEDYETVKGEMESDGDVRSEYDQFLIESDSLSTIVPVRFDYDQTNFKKVYHPLCHFHFGINNDIRVPIDKFMAPLSFFNFIIRNYFPDTFFLTNLKDKSKYVNDIITLSKSQCNSIPAIFFDDENLMFHFT